MRNFHVRTAIFFSAVLNIGLVYGLNYFDDNAWVRAGLVIVYLIAFQPLVYGNLDRGIKEINKAN
jgi:hypothetical protein